MKKIIFIFLLSISFIYGEYTVGGRLQLGANALVGQVGSKTLYGAPFIPSDNYSLGGELFSELGLTSSIYIEPNIGILSQHKMIKYPGTVLNINGVEIYENNIYDRWSISNFSFGLTVKGKTKGLRKKLRFTAAIGLQFLYAYSIKHSQYEATVESIGGVTQETAFTTESEIAIEDNYSPWGLKILAGMGVDFVLPKLKGVVFQVDVRLGYDLTHNLFNDILINENDLDESYFEISSGLYFAVHYRLPLGDAKRLYRKKKKTQRRVNIDEED